MGNLKKTALKEDIFADFAVFAKIREIKFPRKFSKSGVRELLNSREIFHNWVSAKLKIINVNIELP